MNRFSGGPSIKIQGGYRVDMFGNVIKDPVAMAREQQAKNQEQERKKQAAYTKDLTAQAKIWVSEIDLDKYPELQDLSAKEMIAWIYNYPKELPIGSVQIAANMLMQKVTKWVKTKDDRELSKTIELMLLDEDYGSIENFGGF